MSLSDEDIDKIAARVETRVQAQLEQHGRAMRLQYAELKKVTLWTLVFAAVISTASFVSAQRATRLRNAEAAALQIQILIQQREITGLSKKVRRIEEAHGQ